MACAYDATSENWPFDPTKKYFFFLRQLTRITGNLWPSLGHRPWMLHFRKVGVIRCWSTLHFRHRRGDFLRSWPSGGGYTILPQRSPGREILSNVSVDRVFLERILCSPNKAPACFLFIPLQSITGLAPSRTSWLRGLRLLHNELFMGGAGRWALGFQPSPPTSLFSHSSIRSVCLL